VNGPLRSHRAKRPPPVASTVPANAVPGLEACFDNQARLREGDGGDPVIRVQQALVDLGADLGPTGADGTYGPKTAAAVRKFKADENLGSEQFGDVGPGTIGRLDELFAQDKPATPGGSKMDVGDTDDAVEEPSSCPSPVDLESEIGAGGTTESAGTTQALTDTVTAPAADAAGPTPVGATNLDSAVRDFANRLDVPTVGPDDPGNVSAGGQFLFSSKVQVGLDDTLDRMRPDPAAADFIDAAQSFMAAVVEHKDKAVKDALFVTASAQARAAKSATRGTMIRLLSTGASGDVAKIESGLWTQLNKTNSIPSVAHLVSLASYRRMFEFDATACGNGMARAAARVRARGGPGGKSATGKPVVANMVAGPMIRDRRRIGTNRMFGDVFPQNVSAVTALKDALDNGQMVHARVLSGVGKGLGCAKAFDVKKVGAIGPPSEEHSILIFAHDGDEFAFHDPDATASNNPQVGFGRLFFADGKLSTATGAGDLPVTRCGDHAGGAHRYQVIRLAPA
jgi:peptidoglycan hydrolase-like protein with peptidoglycan-binding domain